MTIPENRFEAASGNFVIGIMKLRANYVFSQRRVDIGDLVNELAIREIENKIERSKDRETRKQSGVMKYTG